MDYERFERKEFGSYYTTSEGIMEWTERVLEMLPETMKEIDDRLSAIEAALNIKK